MSQKKRVFLYSLHNENFDQLLHFVKSEKELWKEESGESQISIFLFENHCVWKDIDFMKYQKGILFDTGESELLLQKIKHLIQKHPSLNLQVLVIPKKEEKRFLNKGASYAINENA